MTVAGFFAREAQAQLSTHANQRWHQDSPSIGGVAESGDVWSSALAVGDFDGDGHQDLAVGASGEGVSGADNAGAVNVLYGSTSGLTGVGSQLWIQSSSVGLGGLPELDDTFGRSLAAGDFDGDGTSDLAIGIPGQTLTAFQAGEVLVLYGVPGVGLSATGYQSWHQNTAGVLGANAADDRFGSTLVVGDFDGDDLDDLAIGGPDGGNERGAVWVLYGSLGAGLTTGGHQLWHQDSPSVLGTAEDGDLFGLSMASGDFDNDGYDDLAIGAAWEEIQSADQAGVFHVLYGTSGGLNAIDNQLWWQGSNGLTEAAEENDLFGFKLESGDFDGDGYADLAIATPSEDYNDVNDAGVVHVMYGGQTGLSASRSQLWHQDVPMIDDEAELFDRLGRSLGVGDFDGDGYDDLAMGLPHEDIETLANAGAAQVIYGSSSGLAASGSQFWHQDVPAVLDTAEQGDNFASALVGGDFDGNGAADLAIAVQFDDVGAVSDAGAIAVLLGVRPLLRDGFESSDTTAWFRSVVE